MSITWNDLFLKGSIVDLHASRWTARVGIAAADLGIEPTPEVDHVLLLGSHRLIPREEFVEINAAHGRALRAIRSHSLPFGFVSGARYVPEIKLASLSERLRGHKAEFDAAVNAFVANYEVAKAQMLPQIEKALRDAARTPEAAAEALKRISREYPSAEQVRSRFALRWNIYAVAGPREQGAAAALQSEGETVRSAIGEMVGGLRDEVTVKIGEVVALIAKGGVVQKKTIESSLALVDRIRSMNVLGDRVLEVELERMAGMIKRFQAGEKVDEGMVAGLEQVKAALEGDLAQAAADAEGAIMGVGKRLFSEAA